MAVAVAAPAADAGSWPLHPIQGPHPVRAGILDLRGAEECGQIGVPLAAEARECHWHGGLDIVTDERTCNPQAPRGRCRRVYAVDAGRIWDRGRGACSHVRIGRFGYGHVDGLRKIGRWIREGQPIGWTCKGNYHVHLTEFAQVRKPAGVRLNPLRPGGPLDNFNDADTEAPLLLDFRYVAGELWGRIEDPVPAYRLDGLERFADHLHPYSVSVDGAVVLHARRVPPNGLWPWDVYAPANYRNATARACAAAEEDTSCSGERWWRLGYHDPGATVTVRAVDAAGNAAETLVEVK